MTGTVGASPMAGVIDLWKADVVEICRAGVVREMPLTIELPVEARERLKSKASELGTREEEIAVRLLQDALEPEQWSESEDLEFLRASIAAGEQGRVVSSETLFERLKSNRPRK